MKRYEHFEHEADIGVRGMGESCSEAFEQAALALTAIVTDPERVQHMEKIELYCRADDVELLLTDWLNVLIYEMAVRHMLFGRFDVEISGHTLHATAWGEPVDAARHQPAVEPKGATYTSLSVKKEAGIWTAECVVDV